MGKSQGPWAGCRAAQILCLAVHFLVLGCDAPICGATGCCAPAVQGGHRLSSGNSQCLKVGFLTPSPTVPCKARSQKRAPGSARHGSHPSTPLRSDAVMHINKMSPESLIPAVAVGFQLPAWGHMAPAGQILPPSLLPQPELPPARTVQPRCLAAEKRQEKSPCPAWAGAVYPLLHLPDHGVTGSSKSSGWGRCISTRGMSACTGADRGIRGVALATCLWTE